MATDPKARSVTLSYTGGHVTGTLGAIEFIFGPQESKWTPGALPPTAPGKPRRRKFGTRQRSLSAAGREMYHQLDTGDVVCFRVAGADIDYLDQVMTKALPGRVLQIWTARGTVYGSQFAELK